MSEWRGLANEGLHDPNEETAGKTAWCQCCGAIDCRPAAPCWCCEVYRADVEVERLTAERDALRASVQRVERLLDRCDQDTYDFHWGEGSPVVLTQYVRDALDGGEPDE